jgi:succinate dehydrogenase / fumarate reductase flavoprotein subunit
MYIDDQISKVIETGILVVGGSGAGTMAAVTAARKGAKVTLAVKGKLGRSGNAIMAGGSFAMDGESAYHQYGIKEADPKLTKDALFEEIVKQSFYLSDQNMVEQFVDQCGRCCYELKQWGEKAQQKMVFFPPSGWLTSGKAVATACKQGVAETPGIEVLEDLMIADVLVSNGQVCGAVGIDIYSGDIVVIKAKTVVLATGGYQPYSLKCTVSDMTGDGMAMAYRVGAKLADMEFLLYIPGVALAPHIYKGSIFPFLFAMSCLAPEIKNTCGESIGETMSPEMVRVAQDSEMAKLIHTYYWGKQISAGKGTPHGGVYFDFSQVPLAQYEQTVQKYTPMFNLWYRQGYYQGNNLDLFHQQVKQSRPWEVGLGSEYSMGGIVVDEKMQTGVAGLYAGGETASGVFGAMRVADGLTEMLVQGYQAGLSATDYAAQAVQPQLGTSNLEEVVARILASFENQNGISPVKVHRNIEVAADAGFNFCRNEAGLTKALAEIERIRDEELPRMSIRSKCRAYNCEWLESIQSRNLITCTEAGIRAALMRKESRGTHIRADYPQVDHDQWLVRIMSQNGQNGRMKLTTRQPVVTKLKLPTGKHQDLPDYILTIESDIKNAAF